MPQYRKKPVIIEARRFVTNNDPHDACLNGLVRWIGEAGRHDRTDLYIQTLEGEMKAVVGDYIIKGIKGEFYPCKPDIFEATYELAE